MKLVQLVTENILTEEKNAIYNVSSLNTIMHMDHTWDNESKQSNCTISFSMKKAKELTFPADSENDYDQKVTELQSLLAQACKEFNIRVAKIIKRYVVE